MGRNVPSVGAPPASQRREIRAKRAKQTANKDIPSLLQAYPRARKGIEATELIVDPPALIQPSAVPSTITSQTVRPSNNDDASIIKTLQNNTVLPTIRIQCGDTLQAAAQLYSESKAHKSRTSARTAILNMASPLRPGGGFFTGATSQEESLCMRTTLYPALREEFYRLPEVGGIYTPDVLVFRSYHADATDLPKNERFFIDVITSGMLRFPEVVEGSDGEKEYSEEKDKELVEKKMRAVLRIAAVKKVKKLVLGAWGCGAYGNPVREVARLWRKVIYGSTTAASRRKGSVSISETWEDIEIIFAIKDGKMAEVFATELGLEIEGDVAGAEDDSVESETDDGYLKNEKAEKIAQLEEQILRAKSDYLRQGLRNALKGLKEGVE